MALSDAEQIFAEIYRTNAWGDSESRSGPGSSVFRTRILKPSLKGLFDDLSVRSVLDLPCGDFNWMRLIETPSIDYVGGDIVAELIRQNTALHARPGRRFLRIDMRHDELPRVDLILCRDGLVHLSFSDIGLSLQAMKNSGSTYLLATSFMAHAINEDIRTGEWRPLNLDIAPFNFPAASNALFDGPRADGTYPDKVLALYRLKSLPDRLTF